MQLFWFTAHNCKAQFYVRSGTEAAEMARDLLVRMGAEGSFNSTWDRYLASLPREEETLVAELMTDAQIALLQHPQLVRCRLIVLF